MRQARARRRRRDKGARLPEQEPQRSRFREFGGGLYVGKARPLPFSDEQIGAAVDHRLEHGRSLTRTIRAMDYPRSSWRAAQRGAVG